MAFCSEGERMVAFCSEGERMVGRGLFLATLLLIAGLGFADGPQDNIVDKVRPVPPPGIKIPDEARADLQQRVGELGLEIEELRKHLAKTPPLFKILPHLQISYNPVHYS